MSIICSKCETSNANNGKFCLECGFSLERLISSTISSPQLEGFLLYNRYKVKEVINTSSSGFVYLAWDLILDKPCAVKEVIDITDSYDKKHQFEKIGHILSGLKHANLPRIYECFLINNRYYVVMDFIYGKSLDFLIKKEAKRCFGENKVIDWAIDICNILDYLHGKNFIFRILNPSNILIKKNSGNPVLVNFGISLIFYSPVGTEFASYISPEQLDMKAEFSSDIFSLGATMYYLLSGLPYVPFSQESLKNNKILSPKLVNIILKSLSVNPKDRFQSAFELKDLLMDLKKKNVRYDTKPIGTTDLVLIQLISENPKTRLEALRNLKDIEDKRIITPIIEMLDDPDIQVRKEASVKLGKLNVLEAVLPLIKKLDDKNPDIKSAAITSLGKLKSEKAFPYLLEALKDEEIRVRKSATLALGEFGDKRAIEYLQKARQKESFLSFGMKNLIDKIINKLEILKFKKDELPFIPFDEEKVFVEDRASKEESEALDKVIFYNEQGEFYYKTNNLEFAIENFNKALAIKPDYIEVLFNLASVNLWEFEHTLEGKEKQSLLNSIDYLKKCIDLGGDTFLALKAKDYLECIFPYIDMDMSEIKHSNKDIVSKEHIDNHLIIEEDELDEEFEEIIEEIVEFEDSDDIDEEEIIEEIIEYVDDDTEDEDSSEYDTINEIEEDDEAEDIEKDIIELNITEGLLKTSETAEDNKLSEIMENDEQENVKDVISGSAVIKESKFKTKKVERFSDEYDQNIEVSDQDNYDAGKNQILDIRPEPVESITSVIPEEKPVESITTSVIPEEKPVESITSVIPEEEAKKISLKTRKLKQLFEEEEASELEKESKLDDSHQEVKEFSSIEEKITYYEEVLKNNPDDNSIYEELGSSYFKIKELNKAKDLFNKLFKLQKASVNTHLNLGLIYKEEKNILMALRHFKLCIKIGLNSPAAEEAANHIKEIENWSGNNQKLIHTKEVIADKKKVIADKEPEIKEEYNISYYKTLLEKSPDDPGIYNELGKIYFNQKDYTQAKIHYKKALELNSDFAESHFNLGALYSEEKNILQSLRHFKLCIRVGEDKNLTKKAEDFIKFIENNGLISPDGEDMVTIEYETKELELIKMEDKTYLNKANKSELKVSKMSKEAKELEELNLLLKDKPLDLNVNLKFARLYSKLDMFDKSLDHYNIILNNYPDFARAYLEAAIIYKNKDNPSKALEYINICANKSDNSELLSEARTYIKEFELLLNRSQQNGKKDLQSVEIPLQELREKEIMKLKKIIEENPDQSEEKIKIARLYSESGKFDEAIIYYKDYLKSNPREPVVNKEIAVIYKNQKKIFKALKHLRVCCNNAKDKDLVKEAESYILQIEGASSEEVSENREDKKYNGNSVELLKDKLKENPDNIELLNKLGDAYYGIEQIQGSIDTYLKILTINPSEPKIYFKLGVAYKKQGAIIKALIHFKKYLARSKDKEHIEEAKEYIKELE